MTKEAKLLQEEIRAKVQVDPRWTERAVLVLFEHQTEDEKQNDATLKRNGVGFSGSDAHLMSYYAKWLLSKKHLTGKHLEKAQKVVSKYAGQLAKIAMNRRT
jgi:hypothetical protein